MRLTLAAVLIGAIVLPAVTAHTLAPVLFVHEHVADGWLSHPELILLIGLTVLSCLPLLGAARGAIRWVQGRRRLRFVTRAGTPASFRGIDYVRLPDDQVVLFTAGAYRPAIYATAGAARLLAPAAFEAALLHEQGHIRHHHLAWLPVIACAEAAVGILPGASRAFTHLRIETEWQADQAALRAGAERQGLFEAIVGAAGAVPAAAALSGVGTVERLRWLTDPSGRPAEDAGLGVAVTGLLAPPVIAHALVWTGIICALCAPHFR